MVTESALFLRSIFPTIPENNHLLIWTKRGEIPHITKKSYWFTQVDDAADAAGSLRDSDVYFGVGLSPADFGDGQRCKADLITGIGALWIDIDITDNIHKKPNLPPDENAAFMLLDEADIKPTLVVHSGGGLQAFYCFNEVWHFVDDNDRSAAKDLAHRFNLYWRKIAGGHEWDIDATQDLARVMRVPGTLNHKATEPRPVTLVEINDVRYSVDQIVELLDIHEIKTPPRRRSITGALVPASDLAVDQTSDGPIVYDPAAKIDSELFMTLAEVEPKFLATWNHKRRDFSDQSLSTYDLSLAAFTMRANWQLQDIVNLIIHHRRHYNDPKVDSHGNLRRDYIDRTIARASQTQTQNDQIYKVYKDQTTEDTSEPVGDASESGDDGAAELSEDDQRAATLRFLSERLGVKLVGVTRVLSEPPYFRLDLEKIKINLGDASAILNSNTFRNKVATAALVAIPRFSAKNNTWDQIAAKLLSVVTDEIPDPTETPRGFVEYWLRRYLDNYEVVDYTSPDVIEGMPFSWSGRRYVIMAHFTNWLKLQNADKLRSYSEAFRAAGLVRETRHIPKADNSGMTTQSAWLLPESI